MTTWNLDAEAAAVHGCCRRPCTETSDVRRRRVTRVVSAAAAAAAVTCSHLTDVLTNHPRTVIALIGDAQLLPADSLSRRSRRAAVAGLSAS